MKKIARILTHFMLVAAPVYAVSIVDTLLCKKVYLRYNKSRVLVDRVTGEVKYIMMNGRYVPLAGYAKAQCQSIYNAQTGAR